VLVRCFAGCGQAQVIAALRARGLWHSSPHRFSRIAPPPQLILPDPPDVPGERSQQALRIWGWAMSASGTIAEQYLASRGLALPTLPSVRFHSSLRHPTGSSWPGMVALVTRGTDNEPIGIHRTFLAQDGGGKAPIQPAKMMLGPCRGGAVRLAQAGDTLLVGEGIETTLAAMRATGLPGWAALSTSGLRSLDPPPNVCTVIILADGDAAGEAAAQAAALRWRREGRRVRIARPPQGLDFNDVLLGKVASPVEAAS
jgi:hypothetical protein